MAEWPWFTAGTPVLHVSRIGKTWCATGTLSDGSRYTAAADTRPELDARIRESAAAEGWAGWAVVSMGAATQ